MCAKEYILTAILMATTALAIENNSGVTPLNVENPISGTPNTESHKDLKKVDSNRYDDPPPEYYKGPVGSKNHYDSYDVKYNGQSHKPLANYLNNGHINPFLHKHGFYTSRDRIGDYGGSDYGSHGYSAAYDRYRPYGPPQAVDIPHGNQHYLESYENNDWGSSGGYGYGGGSEHGNPIVWSDKFNHLSKSHLIPLAGAALLGIAAALIVNPVLLHLGTIAGKRRRRRRRDLTTTTSDEQNQKTYAQRIAYNGQIKSN